MNSGLQVYNEQNKLAQWAQTVAQCRESGLSVRQWCQDRGISEHCCYYRLRKLRQMACKALEQAQPIQLAEVPLAPKLEETQAKLRLTTKTGTLEIMDADGTVL